MTNGGTASSRPVGSGIQKRKLAYAGQRQTQPQHQPRHQHPQQQPRLRPQQPPAKRQQNRPGLQTNNTMHPDTPGIGLLASRVHEAPGDEIDDVGFDEFIGADGSSGYLSCCDEYSNEENSSDTIRKLNQLPEDHAQDTQQDGTGDLIIDYPRIVCSFQRSATRLRTHTGLVRREGRRARCTEYRTVRTNIERHLGSDPVYPGQAPLPLKTGLRVYTGQAYSVTFPHPEQTLVEEGGISVALISYPSIATSPRTTTVLPDDLGWRNILYGATSALRQTCNYRPLHRGVIEALP
ncbi:hypothetical protein EDB82DRAFT_476576 [Fusarium venenatum]|uniref:uncharacterized protein n=1 Tax=Fusarium venenatum TaxID=56646 RepID=UPI001DEE7955|nr:hypothetical protein EDB82DRAFT_476576 [Fusarium venenatum]